MAAPLDSIRMILPHCTRLACFALRSLTKFNPADPLAPRQKYLAAWSPASLVDTLYAANISELIIDTCGSELNGDLQHHICPRGLLAIPSLR